VLEKNFQNHQPNRVFLDLKIKVITKIAVDKKKLLKHSLEKYFHFIFFNGLNIFQHSLHAVLIIISTM